IMLLQQAGRLHDTALWEQMLVRMSESPKPQPQLQRIYPGIQVGKRGIRNVHEAKFSAQIVLAAQKMQAQCAARCEVYPRSAGRHIVIREERAPTELEVGNDLARFCKIPL